MAKYSASHSDPLADVVLESKDEVRFRVHSWYMKKQCSFVSDLFEVATKGRSTDQPIVTESSSSALNHFIAMVYSPKLIAEPETVEICNDILCLCDLLGSPHIETRIMRALPGWTLLHQKYPYDTLVLAAKKDNIELAKKALRCMDEKTGSMFDLGRLNIKLVMDLGPKFLSDILRFRYERTTQRQPVGKKLYQTVGWHKVAEDFGIPRFEDYADGERGNIR